VVSENKLKYASVPVSKLGKNCWSAHRFCGGRCVNVLKCNYPEKATCKAVLEERAFLVQHKKKQITKITNDTDEKLKQLEVKNAENRI
jgi:hypothetical protein